MDDPVLIHVTVVYSQAPREVNEWPVSLKNDATVQQALLASGLGKTFPAMDPQTAVVGIWGRRAALETGLRPGDRVEVYRPLKVDPKVARRERFSRQGTRAAGLFSKNSPGKKAGY